MTTYKDFLGRELAIGDHVIIIEPRYRNYLLAEVIAFTPMNVRVRYTKQGSTSEILQCESQLVKVEGPDLTAFLLKQK